MSRWLGVGVLVLFSLVLSLFMRLERKPRAQPPERLRVWSRLPQPSSTGDTYVEHRVVELPGHGWRASRWVEQRRVRRASDDEIVEVLPERRFRVG